MTAVAGPVLADAGVEALGDSLARASLALARRFGAGGTLWCLAPRHPFHADHVAVEFVHPVIVGKRALPAVSVAPGQGAVDLLRASVRAGDAIVLVAGAGDALARDVARRAPAWGALSIWIGAGPRPEAGAADHVLWVPGEETEAGATFVRVYHVLWELTHVCFEHPGLLRATECEGEVCITCADEGRLGEVASVDDDEAVVRTATGLERIDTTLVPDVQPGDLVLVHAGSAIAALDDEVAT